MCKHLLETSTFDYELWVSFYFSLNLLEFCENLISRPMAIVTHPTASNPTARIHPTARTHSTASTHWTARKSVRPFPCFPAANYTTRHRISTTQTTIFQGNEFDGSHIEEATVSNSHSHYHTFISNYGNQFRRFDRVSAEFLHYKWTHFRQQTLHPFLRSNLY